MRHERESHIINEPKFRRLGGGVGNWGMDRENAPSWLRH